MIGSILILQASQIAGRVLFLFFSLWYLNRYLGVEAKGQWSAVWSLFAIFSVFCNMGFEVWLTRAVASGKMGARAAKRALFRVKGPLWLLAFFLGGFWVVRGGFPIALAFPFYFALVFDSVAVSTQAVFEGVGRFRTIALMSFIKSGGFVLLAAPFAFLLERPPLALFGWIFAFMLAFRATLGWRCWRDLPEGDGALPPEAWSQFLVMGALTLVTVIYFQIDGVMLFQMKGELASGNYGNAYNFLEGALFINAAASSVLYPRMIKASAEEAAPLFNAFLRLFLTLAMVLTLTLLTLGVLVGKFLIGDAFQGAIPALEILAWGMPLMFGNGLLSRWLLARGRERFALLSAASAAILNICGNFYLIPTHGPTGAAAMTLATEGLLFLVWVLQTQRNIRLLLTLCLLYGSAGLLWWLALSKLEPLWALVWALVLFASPVFLGLRKVRALTKL